VLRARRRGNEGTSREQGAWAERDGSSSSRMDPLESGIRADADAQNEALYNILTTELKVKTPEYKDLNGIIARVMSGFTSGFTASSEWA
jgi:hypothetical protein